MKKMKKHTCSLTVKEIFVLFSGNLHDHRRTETQRANIQQPLYWRELSPAVHLCRRQVNKQTIDETFDDWTSWHAALSLIKRETR